MKMVSALLVACTLAFMPGDYAMAQVAGSTRLGVSVEENQRRSVSARQIADR